jgi:hypothetical protein
MVHLVLDPVGVEDSPHDLSFLTKGTSARLLHYYTWIHRMAVTISLQRQLTISPTY